MGTEDLFTGGFGRDSMALDCVRVAFRWLTVGPDPVAVDGRRFPGLPNRAVPLNEVRDRLLRRCCPQRLRDAVWEELVLRSRAEGGVWTVGCAGVALPALTRIAATLSGRVIGDPRDVHAAVLAGFVTELAAIDLVRPRIMLRLRWAAYRSGQVCVRESLQAPRPCGGGFGSVAPPPPGGHPDFVLARAVADGVITAGEAELIGSTRLDEVALADAARERGVGYEAVKKTRRRAELRLAAYLRDTGRDTAPAGPHAGSTADDIAARVADTVLITAAARRATDPAATTITSPSVSAGGGRGKKARRPMSRATPVDGVQGCGSNSTVSGAASTPSSVPAPSPALPDEPAGPTPEVPRCA